MADPIDFSSVRRDHYVVVDALNSGCCGTASTDIPIGQIVDQALPQLTPVYYQAGWLVTRGQAGSQAVGNGVLFPMTPHASSAVEQAFFRWRISVLETIAQIDRCYRELLAHHAMPARCFAIGLGWLRQHELQLNSAIRTAMPTLTGGCGQLARAAINANGSIMRDLERLADAGFSKSPNGVAVAYLAFKANEVNQDRTGLLDRFAILCAPRRA